MACGLQACTDDELLQLIHQGGLITLLKGCISQSRPNMSQDSPADAIDMLTDVWTNKAAEVSKKLFERIECECRLRLDKMSDATALLDCPRVWPVMNVGGLFTRLSLSVAWWDRSSSRQYFCAANPVCCCAVVSCGCCS